MKFTVLLSLYDKESEIYLRECLESIKNNTLQPDQIIVVYDGSIGNPLDEVVREFSLCIPIDIVRIPENVGLGKALNYGLKFSKNEIVFRMDTDDKCLPLRFERQMDFLRKNSDVVLLGSAIGEFDGTMKHFLGRRFSVEEHVDIKEYIKKRNPFNHMSIVFKKSIIECVGGYQHHLFMEDYNLWLRVIASGHSTHNLPDTLVHVRAGENMICRRKGLAYIASEVKLAKLKYKLKIDGFIGVIGCLLLRIIPRLLPVYLLTYVYKMLRK